MSNPNINVNVSGPKQPASTYKTVVLKGDRSFVSQVTEENTKYVIKHNFDLSDGAIVYEGLEVEGMGGNPSIIDGEEYWLTDYESGIAEPTTYNLVDNECFFVIDNHISDTKEVILQQEENAWIATKRRGYHARILSHMDPNAAITIPAGCLLEFDGGSISNGTLVGQYTKVISGDYDEIFKSVYLDGIWDKEYFTVANFGCKKGDYGVLNSSIMNNYINTSLDSINIGRVVETALKVPEGVYNITNPIQLKATFDFICEGKLKYDGIIDDNTALTIGSAGSNGGGFGRKYRISLEGNLIVYASTDEIPENYGLKMYGLSNSVVDIVDVSNFAYGVTLIGNDRGFACNTINIITIRNAYRCLTLLCEEQGYVNENLFIGGRIYCESGCSVSGMHTAIALLGSTVHRINSNVFIKQDIEGANIGIYMIHSKDNTFICPRTEEDINAYVNDDPYQENTVIYGNGVLDRNMIKFRNADYRRLVASFSHVSRIRIGSLYSCTPLFTSSVQGNVTQNNLISDSAVRGGFFIDTSVFKSFDVTNGLGRALFWIYDDSYQKIALTSENIDNYIKGASTLGGYSVSNDGANKGIDVSASGIIFTDIVKKVFIAVPPANGQYINIYCTDANYDGRNLVLTPYDSLVLNTGDAPSQSINVENGRVIHLNGRYVKYLTYVNGKWYRPNGSEADANQSGTTAQRPTGDKIYLNFIYFDTDLSKPIFAKAIDASLNVTWVDATGTSV